jgi:OOP family OmpA-OmpF porin
MSDSMFGSLLNMLDKHTVGEVARTLGQPHASVAQGMQSSVAAMLGGMASKGEDTGALRRILDIVPSTSGAVSWDQITRAVTDPDSPLMAIGKRLLPAVFGSGESAVANGLGRQSGLSPGVIATLLSMAGPVVMSFIGNKVRDGGMTMSSLAAILQRESPAIKDILPASVSELFWPAPTPAAATATRSSPVIAQSVQTESTFNWLPIVAIAALGAGLLWFVGHSRRPSIEMPNPSASVGTANRLATPTPKTTCSIPANVSLPAGGAAAQLLATLQNPDPKRAGWLVMDEISFDTGSAVPRPESRPQIDTIATVLVNCPNVRVEIAGFADNVGPADSNLRLSRNRANAVVAQLVNKGVPRGRLMAEGYGETNAVADNSIEQGRAQNRRAAMRVVQP